MMSILMNPNANRAPDASVQSKGVLHVTCMFALCFVLASCSILSNKPAPVLQTFTLGEAWVPVSVPMPSSANFRDNSDGTFSAATETAVAPERRQVLLVDLPRGAAGFNSNRMVYVRQALTQEAYTRSVWVDTPARMLAPWLVNHLQQSGLFRAVLQAPSGAQVDLRLDTTVVRLQQDFLQLPSRVHVEWHMSLMNTSKREVLAWHRIHVVQVAPSDDAAGGAQAANAATQEALRQATDFLRTALAALPPMAHKE